MEFAICFKGVVEHRRARRLVQLAESVGFKYCWFYDSHILWRDSYAAMAMCMEHTTRIRFGPCVTNPVTREWSVAASLFASLLEQSEGRFLIGIGRGDSAVRVMGEKPASLARVAEFAEVIKKLVRGEQVKYGECPTPVQLSWAGKHSLRVWIAAYGPKALKTAGETGDGVILQIAEPSLCEWLATRAIEAGRSAQRDMSGFGVMAAAPAYFGNIDACIEKTRWFPAMVGNHVADIVAKYGGAGVAVPEALTTYIDRRRGYDYSKHGQSDNPFLDFITPDVVRSFCVLGTVDQHINKLRQLQEAGITQFNIYLDNGDEENIIQTYGRRIIPEFS